MRRGAEVCLKSSTLCTLNTFVVCMRLLSMLHTYTMVYNIVYISAPAALCFSLHPFNSHLSIKLFRFLRIGRMMKRWEQRLDIKYSHMAIFKFAFLIIFVCHWLACFWMIAAHLSHEPTRTWCVFKLFLLK